MSEDLAIGEIAARAGIAPSALPFYEDRRLIRSERTAGGQRRYHRDTLRRLAFIRIAQRVGLSLDDITSALASLPEARTPTPADWERLSATWQEDLDKRIGLLLALRNELSACIGCGCLSLERCALYNPADAAAKFGQGPRYLLGNSSAGVLGR